MPDANTENMIRIEVHACERQKRPNAHNLWIVNGKYVKKYDVFHANFKDSVVLYEKLLAFAVQLDQKYTEGIEYGLENITWI